MRMARHGHVIDFVKLQTRRFQTILDRQRRETGRVLDAIEALFFHRGN
jgi:hypothetical protein